MVKDYYQILGVRQGAGIAEIRRAYRMLVQKLHPDVNPDPTAHELIKDVNEAYDVLGDESRRRDYDYRLKNPSIVVEAQQQPVHRDPRYRRSTTYRHVPTSSSYTQSELMQQYLPYMLWFCRAGILFVVVLFVDKVMPPKKIVDDITNIYAVYRAKSRTYLYDIVETKSGMSIKIYEHKASYFYEQGKIKVDRTPILRIATAVYGEDGNNEILVGIIYRALVFFPILLLMISAFGILFRGKIGFSFSLSIISGILLLMNLYFI